MANVILPNVPNVFKCIVKGTIQSKPFVNTFFIAHTGGSMDPTQYNTLAGSVCTAYWGAWAASLNTQTSHQSTTVVDLSSRTAGYGVDSSAHAGSKAGADYAPVSLAACVSWVIVDRYRGGHPRMYLPASLMSTVTGGSLWAAGVANAYAAAGNAMRTSLAGLTNMGASWKQVAVRYYSQHVLLTQPLVRDVTGCVCHTRVDSMRRRTGKETA